MGLGTGELVIILLVVIVLFGGAFATKLPKMARSLGRAQTEFKQGLREGHAEDQDDPANNA
jgi:sec-independent protein translocase protein TatA